MLKENGSKIAWAVIVLCFISLIVLGQIKIKEQNEVSNVVMPRDAIQKNEEVSDLAIDEKYRNLKGTISSVEEGFFVVSDGTENKIEVYGQEFKNYRTRDNMPISQIKVGDYFKNGEIIRNLAGEELRQELLINLARAFNSSKLSTKTIRLKRLEKQEGFVNFKIRFYDENYGLFGLENPELFSINLTADENTVLYARTNIVSIYNLQRAVKNEVAVKERDFYIELDESSLNSERAYVKSFEIAE